MAEFKRPLPAQAVWPSWLTSSKIYRCVEKRLHQRVQLQDLLCLAGLRPSIAARLLGKASPPCRDGSLAVLESSSALLLQAFQFVFIPVLRSICFNARIFPRSLHHHWLPVQHAAFFQAGAGALAIRLQQVQVGWYLKSRKYAQHLSKGRMQESQLSIHPDHICIFPLRSWCSNIKPVPNFVSLVKTSSLSCSKHKQLPLVICFAFKRVEA